MDQSFVELVKYAESYPARRTLWFVDENYTADENTYVEASEAITNRYDIAEYLKQYMPINLSDYDCENYQSSTIDAIYLRLPKSKSLLNYILLESVRLLAPNGIFICIGYNDEGIKTTIKNGTKLLGELVEQELLGKGLRVAVLKKTVIDRAAIEDRNYLELNEVKNDFGLKIYNKAGVYGAKKIDKGTTYLYNVLIKEYHSLPNLVLDLGCGNGLLSLLLASKFMQTKFIATDNNITATEICRKNFIENGVSGDFYLDDCGKNLESGLFECIVCNPPFHQGFDTSKELTNKFLREIHRLLSDNGTAWFVMNRFLNVEQLVQRYPLKLVHIAENDGFKVMRLTKK